MEYFLESDALWHQGVLDTYLGHRAEQTMLSTLCIV